MSRSLLAFLLLAGCAMPPVPPQPIPPPIPTPVVDPVPPPPVPVPTPPDTWVAPWTLVEQVVPGMTLVALNGLLGHTGREKAMDDGTSIIRWAAVDATGAPRWMDVQIESGSVIGRALWKR